MTVQWWTVNRTEDVTSISGTGIIAFLLELNSGILMFWDTIISDRPTRTVEWLPDLQRFHDIHGHQGRTVLTRSTPEQMEAGRNLMYDTIGDVLYTVADVVDSGG